MASQAALELLVSLKDEASKGLDGIAEKGSILHNALGFVAGGAITAGIGAIGGGLTDLFTSSLQESKDAAAGMAQLDSVLASTGGKAGVMKDMVLQLSDELSSSGGLSMATDDAVLKGENLLLTFTNIGSDVFPAATQTMVDMAQAMGTDVSGGAIQLGKALNDPVAGISALSRVGVTFSQSQKDMIKSMMDVGNTAGAQKVILAELSKEFGGSAANAAETFDGKMMTLSESFNNVKQGIGDALMPMLTTLVGFLSSPAVMQTIQDLANGLINGISAGFDLVGKAAAIVGPLLAPIFDAIGAFVGTISSGGDIFGGFTTFLSDIGKGLAGLGQTVISAIGSALPGIIDQLGKWGKAFIDWIGPMVGPALAALGGFISDALKWIAGQIPGIVTTLLGWAKAFVDWVGPMIPVALKALGDFAGEALKWISDQIPTIVTTLLGWAAAFIGWVAPMIPGWLTAIAEFIAGVLGWIVAKIPDLVTALLDWAKAFVEWIGPMIPKWLAAAAGFMGQALQWLLDQIPTIVNTLLEWAKAFIGWIAPMIPPALLALGGVLLSITGWIVTDALPAIVKQLLQWGLAFVGWVAGVLIDLPGKLVGIGGALLKWIAGAIPDIVKALLGWVGAFFGWIGDVVKGIGAELGKIAKAIGDWAGGAAKGVGDVIGGAFDSLKGVAQAVVAPIRAVIDGIMAAIKAAQDAFDYLVGNVRSGVTAPLPPYVPPAAAPANPHAPGGARDPGRASGGPVHPDMTYLVGERGPELFTPATSGYITPNSLLGTSQGGDTCITVNVNNPSPGTDGYGLAMLIAQTLSEELAFNDRVVHAR